MAGPSRRAARSHGGDRVNRIVVDLEDRRPIWAMPDWAVDELRDAVPEGWELQVLRRVVDGSGDGASEPSREVLDAVTGARVYIGFGIPAEVLVAGEGTLEWVHSGAAGVGGSLHATMLTSPVRFTNSAGIHGPPMAETVLGMLLYFARGLDFAVSAQRRGEWDEAPFLAADTPVRELASMTVGVLGYGGIGQEVARRAAALGASVIGLRRTAGSRGLDSVGVEVVSGEAGLRRVIEDSDALVVSAPDTPVTRGLVNGQRIRAMRKGAILINVARGRIVDEEALVDALRSGHLRGAGLDVFHTEPLPKGHPLWALPNVLITPHTSAVTRRFWRREMDLVLENLSRFLEGKPLRNEVDRKSGY